MGGNDARIKIPGRGVLATRGRAGEALYASVGFDHRLAIFDIQASLAHAQMLGRLYVISTQDLTDIQRGFAQKK